jgi:hypothetical protein
VLAETAPLPSQDCVGSHEHEGPPPPGPDLGQPAPDQAIGRAQPGPAERSLVHGDLVTQGEVLEGKVAVAAAEDWEESEKVEQAGDYRAEIVSDQAERSTTCSPDGFWRSTA